MLNIASHLRQWAKNQRLREIQRIRSIFNLKKIEGNKTKVYYWILTNNLPTNSFILKEKSHIIEKNDNWYRICVCVWLKTQICG